MLENTDRKLLWLWLDVAFGPADKRLWDVMSYYDSVEEMCDDLLSLRCGYVTQQEAEKIACCTFFQAKQVAEYCEKKGIYILTPDDPLYPERLKQIECPPAVLFCRGDVSCLSIEKSVAIIGTREPSDYSVAVAEEFSCRARSKYHKRICYGYRHCRTPQCDACRWKHCSCYGLWARI